MLTEPTTGTTNGRSRRRKSSRCCVSDCCDAFVVWLTEPLMQDMPPPPIRITIPAGVKPGGAVFVRQASTGANYLVSVPESLLPVRAPPPHSGDSSPSHHCHTPAPQGDTFYFVPPTPRAARERSMRPATERVSPPNGVFGRPARPNSA